MCLFLWFLVLNFLPCFKPLPAYQFKLFLFSHVFFKPWGFRFSIFLNKGILLFHHQGPDYRKVWPRTITTTFVAGHVCWAVAEWSWNCTAFSINQQSRPPDSRKKMFFVAMDSIVSRSVMGQWIVCRPLQLTGTTFLSLEILSVRFEILSAQARMSEIIKNWTSKMAEQTYRDEKPHPCPLSLLWTKRKQRFNDDQCAHGQIGNFCTNKLLWVYLKCGTHGIQRSRIDLQLRSCVVLGGCYRCLVGQRAKWQHWKIWAWPEFQPKDLRVVRECGKSRSDHLDAEFICEWF